jgi:hypothetical protein
MDITFNGKIVGGRGWEDEESFPMTVRGKQLRITPGRGRKREWAVEIFDGYSHATAIVGEGGGRSQINDLRFRVKGGALRINGQKFVAGDPSEPSLDARGSPVGWWARLASLWRSDQRCAQIISNSEVSGPIVQLSDSPGSGGQQVVNSVAGSVVQISRVSGRHSAITNSPQIVTYGRDSH